MVHSGGPPQGDGEGDYSMSAHDSCTHETFRLYHGQRKSHTILYYFSCDRGMYFNNIRRKNIGCSLEFLYFMRMVKTVAQPMG